MNINESRLKEIEPDIMKSARQDIELKFGC